MSVRVRLIRHPDQFHALLTSAQGGIFKDLHRRALKVQTQAKRNLEREPRRVDTGTLRSDIHIQMLTVGKVLAARIGFNVFYGVYVHDGTGIFGPKGQPITPKMSKFLRWKTKKGTVVYATSVKGMRPNPFLKDALKAAKG